MKLLTEELKKEIPALYSTESIPLKDKIVVCKFINPCGLGAWYVIEGGEKNGDYLFFGLVHLHTKELGYFSLRDLESIKLAFGLKIERDLNFKSSPLSEFWDGG